MSDESMQDANLAEISGPPQEKAPPPLPEIPTSKARTSSLPSYADPSFYAISQGAQGSTPAPEHFAAPPRAKRGSSHFALPLRFRRGSSNSANSAPPPRFRRGSSNSAPPPHSRSGWRSNRSVQRSQFWQMVRHFPQQYWRILSRPGTATFDREQWKAAWGAVWTQVIGIGLLSSLTGVFFMIWSNLTIEQSHLPNSAPAAFFNLSFLLSDLTFGAIIIIFVVIFTLSAFFFDTFVFWALASLLGGRGAYLTHCYCTALIAVPIEALTLAVSYIPQVGPALALALLIYALVLQIFMVMSVHNLNATGAIVAVLLPALILWGGIFEIFGNQLSRLF